MEAFVFGQFWGFLIRKEDFIMLRINICEFAERMERNGAVYEPKPEDVQAAKAPKKKEYER
jgi:hypothetical protein